MIERVGAALEARLTQHALDVEPLSYEGLAVVAITAMREPTDGMLKATFGLMRAQDALEAWRDMIGAALGNESP